MDTPRSWWLLFLCASIKFFHGGLQRTGTVFYVECVSRYNISREMASIPFLASNFTIFLIGPFLGYLENYFQLRSILLFGSILGAIGMGANFWAEDIISLIILCGIIFGIGVGISVCLLPKILNRHFEKHLSTANGLFTAGSSAGATMFPFVCKMLLETYGLSGAFLILGGITLNTIPASLLLVTYPRESNHQKSINNAREIRKKEYSCSKTNSKQKIIFHSSYNIHKNINGKETIQSIKQCSDCNRTKCCHQIYSTSYTPRNVDENVTSHKTGQLTEIKFENDVLPACSVLKCHQNLEENTTFNDIKLSSISILKETNMPVSCNPEHKIVLNNAEQFSACNLQDSDSSAMNCYNLNTQSNVKPNKSFWNSFSVFMNPTFIAIGISQSLFMGVTAAMNVVMLDYFLEKRISSYHSVSLVTALSVTDIVGRVCLGWITDCGFIGIVNLVVANFILLGTVFLLFIWTASFLLCLVPAIFYGIAMGVIMSYSPKIIKDFIETEQRTMAVSSRNVFFTPFVLVIPSILGYFKDTAKSYNGLMYILAIISFMCSILTLTIPYLSKRRKKKISEK